MSPDATPPGVAPPGVAPPGVAPPGVAPPGATPPEVAGRVAVRSRAEPPRGARSTPVDMAAAGSDPPRPAVVPAGRRPRGNCPAPRPATRPRVRAAAARPRPGSRAGPVPRPRLVPAPAPLEVLMNASSPEEVAATGQGPADDSPRRTAIPANHPIDVVGTTHHPSPRYSRLSWSRISGLTELQVAPRSPIVSPTSGQSHHCRSRCTHRRHPARVTAHPDPVRRDVLSERSPGHRGRTRSRDGAATGGI
jgi:hypothetical protein